MLYFCASGTYVVDAQLAGVDISGSPFIVKSFDKTRVRVFGLTDGVVNKLTTFSGLWQSSSTLTIIIIMGARSA